MSWDRRVAQIRAALDMICRFGCAVETFFRKGNRPADRGRAGLSPEDVVGDTSSQLWYPLSNRPTSRGCHFCVGLDILDAKDRIMLQKPEAADLKNVVNRTSRCRVKVSVEPAVSIHNKETTKVSPLNRS